MSKKALCFLFCVILIGGCNTPKIELSVTQVFSNHMVLQQDQLNAIWGTGTPNTEITLTSSWGEKVFSKVDALGNWMLYLPTPPFDKNAPLDGYTIDVTDGISEIKISDVLIGEVWLASGQSNMVWSMNQCDGCVINQAEEIRNSDNPFIRMFTVPPDLTNESLKHTKWLSASQKNTGNFSAVAYYFAKKLYDEIKVPIGIVNSSWGGTRIESWISAKKLNGLDETKGFIPEDYTFLGYQDKIRKQNDSLIEDLNEKYGFSSFNVPSIPAKKEVADQFLQKWEHLDLKDTSFKDPDFDDDSWGYWTPGLYDYGGLKSKGRFESVFKETDPLLSDGVIWFRTEIEVNDLSKDHILHVERGIDDADQTYFNGKLIGNTLGWNLERKYTISKSLLRKGRNTLAFRITDPGGGGGFNSEVRIYNDQDSMVLPFEKFKFKHHGFIINGMSFVIHNYSNDELIKLPEKVRKDISLKSLTPMRNQFSAMHECILSPIMPYGIRGFIWYQGEDNVNNFSDYTNLLSGLIDDWRSIWGSNLPFYFAQIAPFIYEDHQKSQGLREAQRKVLDQVEKTGMAVLLDIGEELDIHPENKKDVGERLSLHALKNEYGSNIIISGPLYREHISRGNYIEVFFDYAENGLISKGDLKGFEVAGSDGVFYQANATISKNSVRVFSKEVPKPLHVRYGWENWFVGTLFNSHELPASSFSSL